MKNAKASKLRFEVGTRWLSCQEGGVAKWPKAALSQGAIRWFESSRRLHNSPRL